MCPEEMSRGANCEEESDELLSLVAAQIDLRHCHEASIHPASRLFRS